MTGMGLNENWGNLKWVVIGINRYKNRKKKKSALTVVCFCLRSLAVFGRWKVMGTGLNKNWGKRVVIGISEYKN